MKSDLSKFIVSLRNIDRALRGRNFKHDDPIRMELRKIIIGMEFIPAAPEDYKDPSLPELIENLYHTSKEIKKRIDDVNAKKPAPLIFDTVIKMSNK